MKPDTKYMRPLQYAESRGFSVHTLKKWMDQRLLPFIKVRRLILIDPIKADSALEAFERKAAVK
jgi:hypothetical protein